MNNIDWTINKINLCFLIYIAAAILSYSYIVQRNDDREAAVARSIVWPFYWYGRVCFYITEPAKPAEKP